MPPVERRPQATQARPKPKQAGIKKSVPRSSTKRPGIIRDGCLFHQGEAINVHKVHTRVAQFYGAFMGTVGTKHYYIVDELVMIRVVETSDIFHIDNVEVTASPIVWFKEKNAGCLGKHPRAFYEDPVGETCTLVVKLCLQLDKETILDIFEGFDMDGTQADSQCTPLEDSTPGETETAQYTATPLTGIAFENDDVASITVSRCRYVPVAILLKRNGIQFEHMAGDFETSQYTPDKCDRGTELWGANVSRSLADTVNPSLTGPAWKSQLKLWISGEFPSPFANTKVYNWEQTVKAIYHILRVSGVNFWHRNLPLPEPFRSYFVERCFDELRTDHVLREEFKAEVVKAGRHDFAGSLDDSDFDGFTKKFTHSQPQLSRVQYHQMFGASNSVHRRDMCMDGGMGISEEQFVVSKVVLVAYRFSGFHMRLTRMYTANGKTSMLKGVPRNFKKPSMQCIYVHDNVKPQTQKKIIFDLHGKPARHTGIQYRGKYAESQRLTTDIYMPLKQRRNVDTSDDTLAQTEQLSKASLIHQCKLRDTERQQSNGYTAVLSSASRVGPLY